MGFQGPPRLGGPARRSLIPAAATLISSRTKTLCNLRKLAVIGCFWHEGPRRMRQPLQRRSLLALVLATSAFAGMIAACGDAKTDAPVSPKARPAATSAKVEGSKDGGAV